MALKEIIIKIDNEAIYFNPSLLIPIQNSNLPKSMKFRSVEEIYWKVELLNYDENTKCWHLRVLDYEMHDFRTFTKQTPLRPIDKICFEKLDWLKLEPQLSFYKEIDLIELLFNHTPPKIPTYIPEENFKRSGYLKPELIENKYPETNTEPVGPNIEQLKFHFSISYKEAIFLNGFVSFKRHVQKLRGKIEFKIHNDYIKEEFDNIKLWFS